MKGERGRGRGRETSGVHCEVSLICMKRVSERTGKVSVF